MLPDATRPDRAPRPDVERLRHASTLASKVYPGPVGELIDRELRAWDECGYRFGGFLLVRRLVDHLIEKAGKATKDEATADADLPPGAPMAGLADHRGDP